MAPELSEKEKPEGSADVGAAVRVGAEEGVEQQPYEVKPELVQFFQYLQFRYVISFISALGFECLR
jgi:hypothetical protein